MIRKRKEIQTPDTAQLDRSDTFALLIAALTVMLPIILLALGLVALLIAVMF